MIFFGTLMAAGLVALGEPAASRIGHNAAQQPSIMQALNQVAQFARPAGDQQPSAQAR
jgi:hypothetical protein